VIEKLQCFGSHARLVGIAAAGARPRRHAAVVLANSGVVHRIGANRISVAVARRLAADGFDTLRFDMSGLGDSSARDDGLAWESSAPLELSEGVDLVTRDYDRPVVLYGNCGGAAKSLWAARRDERVRGLVLTNPPPHPAERELDSSGTDLAERALETVATDLEVLFARGVCAAFVYAEGDEGLDYYDRRLAPRLAGGPADARLDVVRIARSNHTFSPAVARRAALEHIHDWVVGRFGQYDDA